MNFKIYDEKLNKVQQSEGKKVRENVAARNPLSSLCDNALHHRVQKNTVKSVQNGCEESSSKSVQTEQLAAGMEGAVQKSNEEEARTCSAIIHKPATKPTLVQRRIRRRPLLESATCHDSSLYDEEYFQDNLKYMLEQEDKFVYRLSLLDRNVDEDFRMRTVNWLVYVQGVFDLQDETLLITIRMMDSFLIYGNVPRELYPLVGVTSMWIANKLFDSRYIKVSKLFAICEEKFPKFQILSMERELLEKSNFMINFPEPIQFLYYFLQSSNLDKNDKIWTSAKFLIECSSLLLEFSATAPSVLAASAIYLVLTKFDLDRTGFLNYIHFVYEDSVDIDVFEQFSKHIGEEVAILLKCEAVTKQIVNKYSSETKFNVVKYFKSD